MEQSIAQSYETSASGPSLHKASTSYVYRDLETSTTIRILGLLPGCENEALKCEIVHTDLNAGPDAAELDRNPAHTFCYFSDRNSPEERTEVSFQPRTWLPYEALSYVWGNPQFTQAINTPEDNIAITPNLAQGLRPHHHCLPRHVWVDAVCMNETALSERNHQVKKMGDTFAQAEGVLAWLGPDPDQRASTIIRSFKFALPYTTPKDIYAMKKLTDLEWFSRLWVVQEMLRAKEALFIWGDETVDVNTLMFHLKSVNAIGQKWRGQRPWLFLKDSQARLFDVLRAVRHLKCADIRDHVYGILGTDTIQDSHHIEPDYTKTVQQVFEESTKYLGDGYTDIVLAEVDYDSTAALGPPSYVPNWSASLSWTPLGLNQRDLATHWSRLFARGRDLGSWEFLIRPENSYACYGTGLGDIVSISSANLDEANWHTSLQTISTFWAQVITAVFSKRKPGPLLTADIANWNMEFALLLFGYHSLSRVTTGGRNFVKALFDLSDIEDQDRIDQVCSTIDNMPEVCAMIKSFRKACSFQRDQLTSGHRVVNSWTRRTPHGRSSSVCHIDWRQSMLLSSQ